MTKQVFTVVDPNGVTHKRTSVSRTYTHTVIAQRNKTELMRRATDKEWTVQDGRNYDYYTAVANGNDPYPCKNYSGTAEGQLAADKENALRVAKAKAKVDGMTRDEYLAAQLAQRIKVVEETDYNEWHNLGWCGRYDLANKLASNDHNGYYHNLTILEAKGA